MTEAWNEAKKFLVDLGNYPLSVKKTEFERARKDKRFRQGEFVIDTISEGYTQSPEKLGMGKSLEIDRKMYDKILEFAKKRNLTTEEDSGLIYLIDSNNRIGIISSCFFTASKPELFEEIGKEIYGLKS